MSASLYLCVNLCMCAYTGVHASTHVVNKWERNRGGARRAGLSWDKCEVITTHLTNSVASRWCCSYKRRNEKGMLLGLFHNNASWDLGRILPTVTSFSFLTSFPILGDSVLGIAVCAQMSSTLGTHTWSMSSDGFTTSFVNICRLNEPPSAPSFWISLTLLEKLSIRKK